MLNFINYLDDRFHLLSENSKRNSAIRATASKLEDQVAMNENVDDCKMSWKGDY